MTRTSLPLRQSDEQIQPEQVKGNWHLTDGHTFDDLQILRVKDDDAIVLAVGNVNLCWVAIAIGRINTPNIG